MENFKKFIDIKCTLIDIFLLQMTKNILDISYSLSGNSILLQIVLLEDTALDENVINKVHKYLSDYTISIKTLFLSKKQFNENPGVFSPIYYTWLTYNLYSKAETL
jgi:predicted regulator of amino acid metabolism with ACT domain